MSRIILILFVYIISSLSVFSNNDFKVDFFDVGQGNCVIINCPNGHPLLIDAGSSSSQGKEDGFKAKTIADVVNRLGQFMPPRIKTGEIGLTVIASHGDIDHINWIKDIIEDLKKAKKTPFNIRILLGGKEDDYKGSKKGEFKDFAEKYRNQAIDEKLYISEHLAAGTDNYKTLRSGEVEIDILAALNVKDTNANSIVLGITHKKFTIILPGDATGKTLKSLDTDKIGQYHTNGNEIIALASHHGATEDDCNSDMLVNLIKAKTVIFSTIGHHDGFNHPRFEAIERYFRHVKDGDISHELTCYGTITNVSDEDSNGLSSMIKKEYIAIHEISHPHFRVLSLEKPLPRFRFTIETTKSVYSTGNSKTLRWPW